MASTNILTPVTSISKPFVPIPSATPALPPSPSGVAGSTSGSEKTQISSESTAISSLASTANATAQSHPPSSSGTSAGALAGIAVGSVVAGILVGLAAAFILLRKRKKRSSEKASSMVAYHDTNAPAEAIPFKVPNDALLRLALPDATPVKDIVQEVQCLGNLIGGHVMNFYHDKPTSADPRALSELLVGLGFPAGNRSSSLSARKVAALCHDPMTRRMGLQRVLVHVLSASIDHHSPGRLSMIPAPVAEFLRAMPPDKDPGGGDARAFPLALCQWRKLSVFLLHPDRGDCISLPFDVASVEPQAEALTESLNAFLNPFIEADPHSRHEQASHLHAVVIEHAKLGYLLLSQPSDWGLVTAESSLAVKQGRVVIVEAGLDRLSDEEGIPYPSPQRVVEPQVLSY